jgi:hypothetical protein
LGSNDKLLLMIRLAGYFIICLLFVSANAAGQDSTQTISPSYLTEISSVSGKLKKKLDKKSEKALSDLQRLEARLKKKLSKTDSLKARQVFSGAEQSYKQLEQKLQKWFCCY